MITKLNKMHIDETLAKILFSTISLNNTLTEYEYVLNTDNLYQNDIFEYILDHYGLPSDNSAVTDYDDPECFCRDWWYTKIDDLETEACCLAFIRELKEQVKEGLAA